MPELLPPDARSHTPDSLPGLMGQPPPFGETPVVREYRVHDGVHSDSDSDGGTVLASDEEVVEEDILDLPGCGGGASRRTGGSADPVAAVQVRG